MKLSERFSDALVYAHHLHADQTRKGAEVPYISHLMAVSSLVLEQNADEETAIAALLHDALEDQGGPETRREITSRFGEKVLAVVEGCTEKQAEPKPPWKERKENYIRKLASASPEVLLVSLADKVHNARGIWADYQIVGESIWSRFNGGREGSLWYYRALVEGFRQTGKAPIPLLNALDHTVGLIEQRSRQA